MSSKNRLKKPLRGGRLVLLFDSAPNIYGEVTPSGLNNEFSMLETLLYLKFAEFGDDKCITFNFSKLGIPKTTFPGMPADEDPTIMARSDWVNFFAAHKADVDAMWATAIDYIHKDRGLENVKSIDVDEVNSPDDSHQGVATDGDATDQVPTVEAPAQVLVAVPE